MIFVTVGTHEQPFNRLVMAMEDLVVQGIITERVVIQAGYATAVAHHCEVTDFLSNHDLQQAMQLAETVVCHGGPATFMQSLALGKRTIVVPRQAAFQEHVNDHQLTFARQVEQRGYPLTVVDDVAELATIFTTARDVTHQLPSHTHEFNHQLAGAIRRMGVLA
ncbi:glycosyltransferase [Levilactobacillus yonginensis]|uniref:glycosyltransferase n=1 Tax=Levilactobacillus yonginensis TaxID=1054041 RepID=UPI00345DAEBC